MDGSGKGTKTIDLAPCPNLDLGLGQEFWPTRSLCNRHQSAGQLCEGEGFSSEMSGADCTDEQVTFATFSVGT